MSFKDFAQSIGKTAYNVLKTGYDTLNSAAQGFNRNISQLANYARPSQVLGNLGTAVGAYNDNSITRQEAYNSAEAQKQRDWEEYMSNTAVQRSVADIEAAGLNPWLAIQGGASGASTPAGASASSNSAFASNYIATSVVGTMAKVATSAMQLVSKIAMAAAAA